MRTYRILPRKSRIASYLCDDTNYEGQEHNLFIPSFHIIEYSHSFDTVTKHSFIFGDIIISFLM